MSNNVEFILGRETQEHAPRVQVWLEQGTAGWFFVRAMHESADAARYQTLLTFNLRTGVIDYMGSNPIGEPKLKEALGYSFLTAQKGAEATAPSIARLYYEAHITVKPPAGVQWETFRRTAETSGFRASKFDVDEVDHYDGAWFLSYRDTNLISMKNTIANEIAILKTSGYDVIRWKIEDTLLDSKHGDML